MTAPLLEHLQIGDIRMRVATQGQGPVVLFCHGWPESWYSWRNQMAAVAAAGYRAVAPDMRGYGGTDAPQDPRQYSLLHLVGDMVGLLKGLGETQAVVVGHDWGAPVAWHAALMRPDLFRAVVGMSVPYAPPWPTDIIGALEKQGITDFYLQYFQTAGVAEAEFERDVVDAVRRIHFSGSGDAPDQASFGMLAPGTGFLANTIDPPVLPDWMSEADVAYYAGEFGRVGFRGGLNWYRCLRLNAELLAPWYGMPIQQPAMFVAGERDSVLRFPASKAQIARYSSTLPGLRGCHILEGAGHWIQRERADVVNTLLLAFLRGL